MKSPLSYASRDYMDLVRKMLIGSQLLLRCWSSRVFFILYPLPCIYLELSQRFQSVVSNNYCKHTSAFLNDDHFGRHTGFISELQRDSPELLVYYSVHTSRSTLQISACCELFQAYN